MSSGADHTGDDHETTADPAPAPAPGFEHVIEGLPETFVTYDHTGRITFANEEFRRRTARSMSELVGRRPFEWDDGTFAESPDVKRFREHLDAVLRTGEPSEYTRSHTEFSDETVSYRVFFRPIRDQSDQVVGAFMFAQDVSELALARRDAAKREHEFQTLAENLPEVLMRFDTEGRVVYTNRQYDEQVGGPSIIGRTVEELDPLGASGSGFREAVRRALTAGEEGRVRLTTSMADGRRRTHSILVQPEFGAGGSVSGVIAIGHDITELEEARLATARSEEQFRSLAEHMPDNVIRYDVDCRATYVNRTLTLPGEPTSDDVLGRTPSELGDRLATNMGYYESLIRQVLATGEPASAQLSFLDRTGSKRFHSVLIGPERSSGGDVVGAIAIGRDVTDLVRANEELAAREREYRTLAENLPDLVLRYDLDGRATYIAEQFASGVNAPLADEIGRRPTEIQPPGMTGLEEYERRLLEVIATGEPAEAEIRLLDADGEPRVHSVQIRAERDPDGTIRGALAIGRDVTDLVRAEQAAEARARDFLSLAENLPDLVLRYDLDARITYINRAVDAAGALSASEMVGRTPRESAPDGLTPIDEYEVRLRKVIETGDPASIDVTFTDGEGRERVHDVLFRAERSPDGAIIGAIAIGRDITDRVRAEQEAEARAREFRSLAQHMPDIVVHYDTAGRATFINRPIDLPGFPRPDEIIGRRPAQFLPTMVRVDEYEALLNRVLATGRSGSMDVWFRDNAGVERMHRVRIGAEHAPTGEVVGAIAIGRDVTDLVRAEQAARERALEFLTLAENLPDMVIRYDVEARATYVNRDPEMQLRGPSSSMIGLTPSEHAPGGTAGVREYEQVLRGVIATGEPASIDMRFVANDGLERVRSVLLRAERSSTGEVVGAIAIGRDVTDRVRAEQEAAERAHEFRTLAENLPDMVIRYDVDARIRYVNHALDVADAREAREMIGRTPSESSPPSLTRIGEYEALLRHVIATGEPATIDMTFLSPSGAERVHNVAFRAEHSTTGEIIGAIAIGRDVTELVRAEEAAEARAREFLTLAENLPDMVVRYDVDARATYLNRTPDPLGAASADEMVGLTPLESAPEGIVGVEQYEAMLRRVLATGEPGVVDLSFIDRAGDERVHNVLFRAERAATGEIVGAIAIGRDVTDLVRAEEAAEARAREFHTLAENLPDIVLRYDAEGRTVYVNPQHDEQVNMPRTALLGRRPSEISFEGMEGVREYERTLMRVIRTGQPAQTEIRLIDPAGVTHVHNVLFRAERSTTGELVGAIAIGRDVTELVRAEEAAEARAREFHTLAENLPDIVLRYDADVRLTYLNRRLDLADEHDIGDLIGRTPTEGAPRAAGSQVEFEAALRHAIATGDPTAVEMEFTDRAGNDRVHNVLVHPERSSTGEIIGAVAIGRDVTDLVRAERAAEASALEYRSLAENLPDLVIRYDLTARATYANRILDFPNGPSDMGGFLGRTPLELGTTDLQGLADYERTLRRVLTTGKPATAELVFTDAMGEEHIRSVLLAPERDSDGVIVGAISIGRDVTGLVRAEREAAARAREFRTLADNATDFIGRWDVEGRRTYVNPALARLQGKDANDMIGELLDPGPDGAFKSFVDAVWATIEDRGPRAVLQRFVDRAGAEQVHDVQLVPEFDESGQFVSVLGIGRDITEVVHQREALEQAARTDALTGVASRKVLYEALPELLARRGAIGRRVGVLLLDLDGFKDINDQYGHRLGDHMLRQIAGRLSTCIGDDDLLVRVGGDEFVLVLGDMDGPTDASVLAHQARMLLTDLEAEGQIRFPAVDASVGIAMFPDDGDDIDALLAHADLALYEAKRAGRGRVKFFHAELRAAMERRSAIEQALNECNPDVEMAIHLQPICTLGGDPSVWGAEALLRWHHPHLGSVPPDEFIRIAEQSGQIVPIGRWVMRQAAEVAVALNRGRSEPLRVAINVSTRQFTLDDIGDATFSALEATGCDPRWLILEITESLLLEDLPLVHRALDSLRALGVAVAIDDFGTGYSSLHYLTRLRIDHMKVDKAFVRDADVDHQQQEIVRALVAMAHALGIDVVAEGIESPGQAGLLEQLGCRLGQGYLLARPMPVDQFTTWLATAPATLREALPT